MEVRKNTDVFNLMDTNGRRDDVINALQGYMTILDDILNTRHLKWKHMPDSTAQFHFYEEAYRFSQGVFKRNKNYFFVKDKLEKSEDLRNAIYTNNTEWIAEHKGAYSEVFKKIDNGIEDRARHYTSNLVKLGFVDSDRNISKTGQTLLGQIKVKKDEFERILPIDDTNIIYLRQLMKLRVYTKDKAAFYSPFCMALFILLKRKRVSQSEFAEMIQLQNPYNPIKDLDSYVDNYCENKYLDDFQVDVPAGLKCCDEIDEGVFGKYFPNGKTENSVDVYFKFYKALFDFNQNRTQQNLDRLLDTYEAEKDKIKKAFGYGKNIFSVRKGDRPAVSDFVESEDMELFGDNFNERLYIRFVRSKKADDLREKSDTTRRIFKATGIISFDNGYVELAYRELCENIFDIDVIRRKCMGRSEDDLSEYYNGYDEYEGDVNTFFCDIHSMVEILECSEKTIKTTLNKITAAFGEDDIENISAIIQKKRKNEFEKFIDKTYPEVRVKKLLSLFANRDNDKEIKKEVNPDASVPTIYEYIVGLAWYYFSNKSVNILESFNLTLSADFEPITHAGGGAGDIVIYGSDKVIMLEATLMNANSQKRGEWEPVLRHSVNLKVEEEVAKTGREVTTFFIADNFDSNTINIWKAISSVPMQSSADKDKFTDNVIIMPINSRELSALLDKKAEYNEIIQRVRQLFIADKTSFDLDWRNRFISEVL